MLPIIMLMNRTFKLVRQLQLNIVLIRVALVMGSVHSSKTLRHKQNTYVPKTTIVNIKSMTVGWRDGSVAKSTDCSSRGPEFSSQQPHGG